MGFADTAAAGARVFLVGILGLAMLHALVEWVQQTRSILAGLREPRLSGFRISFAYVDNHGVRRDFTGRVSGSTMEGSFRTDGGAEGHWTAARKQG